MKLKTLSLLTFVFVLIFSFTACINTKTTKLPTNQIPDPSTLVKADSTQKVTYIDGSYEDKSSKTSEGYYGKAKISISQGLIANIDFQIYDTRIFKSSEFNKNVPNYRSILEMVVDKNYGPTVYATNAEYRDQCVNELAGIEEYKKTLITTQDVDKVNIISGATWSNGIFKESVKNALKTAKK